MARELGAPRHRPLVLVCGLAAALTVVSALADQSDDLSRLREEAAKQRRDLEGTEARIRALEQKDGNAARTDTAPATQPSPLVQLKRNWSQVQPGTPQDRVEALLGTPEKVLRIDGALVWYYVYPEIGRGSVFFNASGKVSSRQSPSFGW
jgi:SmpA/OmlA family protein